MRSPRNIPESEKGDCFANAARLLCFEDDVPPEARLVHAVCRGQNKIEGILFAHAWMEIGDWVFDVTKTGTKVMVDKKGYYKIGNVKVIATYTAHEARKQMVESGHYGPWHELFDTEEVA